MKIPENQLPPPILHPDEKSMELLRLWLVDGGARFVITPNLWDDAAMWGLLLADCVRHLGNAYEASGKDRSAAMARIKAAFDAEWKHPTSTGKEIP